MILCLIHLMDTRPRFCGGVSAGDLNGAASASTDMLTHARCIEHCTADSDWINFYRLDGGINGQMQTKRVPYDGPANGVNFVEYFNGFDGWTQEVTVNKIEIINLPRTNGIRRCFAYGSVCLYSVLTGTSSLTWNKTLNSEPQDQSCKRCKALVFVLCETQWVGLIVSRRGARRYDQSRKVAGDKISTDEQEIKCADITDTDMKRKEPAVMFIASVLPGTECILLSRSQEWSARSFAMQT